MAAPENTHNRRPRSRSKPTAATAEKLIVANCEPIARLAISAALAGDTSAQRLCLELGLGARRADDEPAA